MPISTNARLLQVSGYLAALLPAAAIYLSSHIHILYRTPLALSFVLIGAVARTFGRGPSIMAPLIMALGFNYFVALPEYAWSVSAEGIAGTCIILILGFAIAHLFQGQQVAELSLRLANRALQEKTNALIQAQQGSNSAA